MRLWLDEQWLALQLAPPTGLPSGDPVAELPQHVPAVDEAEQAELEMGGAITALRQRGYAWIAIARSIDLSLDYTLTLARRYRRRVAAELVRAELAAAETAPPLVEASSGDDRPHDRRPHLPAAETATVATARLPADEHILAATLCDQPG